METIGTEYSESPGKYGDDQQLDHSPNGDSKAMKSALVPSPDAHPEIVVDWLGPASIGPGPLTFKDPEPPGIAQTYR